MSRKFSMQDRLLQWLLIPLICLCALSTNVAYNLASQYANDAYDAYLLNSSDSIAARLGRNEKGIIVADLPLAAQAILRHNRDKFYYQIVDNKGHRLTGDAVLPMPRSMSEKGARFRYVRLEDGQKLRVCRIAVQVGEGTEEVWVQVAETLNSRNALLQQIFMSILVPQLALVALASISVWLGVRNGLLPLNKLSCLIKSRNKLDLSAIQLEATPTELEPVIVALNDLLAKARKQIDVQRQFIGDAAHQLRTPVTALKTYVDYAERVNENSQLNAILLKMGEATSRTVHLINRLLSLARVEGNRNKPLEDIDLTEAVNNAAAVLVHEALKKNIELQFDTPENPVQVHANKADLEELISNLLDNAIKYTQNGGFVWVKIITNDQITLVIEDNGPGIPDEEKNRVFERFYRGEKTAGTGCGLGLSIVSEIVSFNQAAVELRDREGGGTSIHVKFAAQKFVSQHSQAPTPAYS